jgi:hypothetical protein
MKTEQIKNYGEEIGVPDMTLETLIDSHRNMRNSNVEITKIKETAYADAYSAWMKACPQDSILVENLRNMTIQEIYEMLRSIDGSV